MTRTTFKQFFEMAKRTTPADFYKMSVDLHGAEKSKSLTMPEVKAVAVKNDVQIPPYVVKQKVGRGRFNLKPEGSDDVKKDEPKKVDEPKDTGKVSDEQLKATVHAIVGELKNLSNVYQTQSIESYEIQGKKTFHGGVRDWGQWEVPEDEEDDGDYDWKVLTKEWRDKLRTFEEKMVKKYPNLKIWLNTEEKDWISVQVTNK